jgi:hypothetical protein
VPPLESRVRTSPCQMSDDHRTPGSTDLSKRPMLLPQSSHCLRCFHPVCTSRHPASPSYSIKCCNVSCALISKLRGVGLVEDISTVQKLDQRRLGM